MPENNPTMPPFTPRKITEPTEEKRTLLEATKAISARVKKESLEKQAEENVAEPTQVAQPEQPKRKVVRPRKVRPDSKVVSEENSKLEKKIGIRKRKRFEDANTRVTTYIDNDQLEQLRKIKKEYNVPMTEVIHKALAAYLTT